MLAVPEPQALVRLTEFTCVWVQARYVKAAEELGWVPGEHPATEVLAQEVYLKVRPGTKEAAASRCEVALMAHVASIRAQLAVDDNAAKGLRLAKVHELLSRKGVEVSYASLRLLAIKHCGFEGRRRRITVRLEEVPPGEERKSISGDLASSKSRRAGGDTSMR